MNPWNVSLWCCHRRPLFVICGAVRSVRSYDANRVWGGLNSKYSTMTSYISHILGNTGVVKSSILLNRGFKKGAKTVKNRKFHYVRKLFTLTSSFNSSWVLKEARPEGLPRWWCNTASLYRYQKSKWSNIHIEKISENVICLVKRKSEWQRKIGVHAFLYKQPFYKKLILGSAKC